AEMKRSPALSDIPVIVASTRGDPETRRRVLELGAQALLSKPVEPPELARIVEPFLAGAGGGGRWTRPGARGDNEMEQPLILVVDDSQTIRRLVECHLSQAGYRVAMAGDAEHGLELARASQPQLILLDHQLPGTTGDEVCRRLLDHEATARIPVVISSAMRNRAYAQYTEYSNVVDQIPKPFTPELLKSGVANALQTGPMIVQAQRTGCAVPEAVGEVHDALLEGKFDAFSPLALLDFLNNHQQSGRLTLDVGKDRVRFALAGGRVQAVYSPTIHADRLQGWLPAELVGLGPLLALTLGEQQDASMAGLIKLLERSLSDPR